MLPTDQIRTNSQQTPGKMLLQRRSTHLHKPAAVTV
jgi:hypothetical protein